MIILKIDIFISIFGESLTKGGGGGVYLSIRKSYFFVFVHEFFNESGICLLFS